MPEFIVAQPDQLKALIVSALEDFEAKKNQDKGESLWTVNQVAKRLKKAHATIKKLISQGHLRTTTNGLIPESSINEFLQKS